MSTITEIKLPQLAESQVSATIDRWLKQPGDLIEVYEPICEVNTDKVNAELPSTVAGKLVKILVGNGEEVPVGTVIGLIETEDAASGGDLQDQQSNTAAIQSVDAEPKAEDATASMRHRYSPAVQQLAAEHNLQLSDIQGTGLGGRITRKDVLTYVANRGEQAAEQTQLVEKPSTQVRSSGIHLSESPRIPSIEIDQGYGQSRGETYIDVTPIRNTIARNMRQSVSEIPHAWTMIEVDVSNLVLLRNKYKDE